MKRFLLLTVSILLIPFLIVTFFIKNEEIKFELVDNMMVRVKRDKTGVIENVPLEEYIVGVVAGENPVTFNIEALKAQAVAARSYVLTRMQYNVDKEYDVVDTVTNQVYLDNEHLRNAWKDKYTENVNKIRTAVLETEGEYLDYNGKIADAMYFSTSTGMTENSEEVFGTKVAYLQSVKSEWDKEASPVFSQNYEMSLNDFYIKLNLKYKDKLTVENIETTSTGRIKKIKINGVPFTGNTVYSKLGLRSTHFVIRQEGNNVYITTKGYGHGVGMSQYGANGMANEGYNYDEILAHYYQGTKLKKI